MSTDREDRWGNDDDRSYRDDDRRPRGNVEEGRRRVAMPAILLIVFGLIAMLVEFASLGATFASPNIFGEQFKKFIEQQPDSPQKKQALDDFEKNKDQYRLDTPMNIGGTIVGLVMSVLMLLGGIKMKSLSGYGLAMTGAICAMIPCFNGCLCCAMPVGLWALVVLMNADVKAAFQAARY